MNQVMYLSPVYDGEEVVEDVLHQLHPAAVVEQTHLVRQADKQRT